MDGTDATNGMDGMDVTDLVLREQEQLQEQRHLEARRERRRRQVMRLARRFKRDPLLRDRSAEELRPLLAVHLGPDTDGIANAYLIDIWDRIDDRLGWMDEIWVAASTRPDPPAAALCPHPRAVDVLKLMEELAERSRAMDVETVQKEIARRKKYRDGRRVQPGDFVAAQVPAGEALGMDQRDVSRWIRYWCRKRVIEAMSRPGPGRATVYRFVGATT